MTVYLMQTDTGSVDTEENWRSDFEEMDPEFWGGTEFEDGNLIEVKRDTNGDWIEVD